MQKTLQNDQTRVHGVEILITTVHLGHGTWEGIIRSSSSRSHRCGVVNMLFSRIGEKIRGECTESQMIGEISSTTTNVLSMWEENENDNNRVDTIHFFRCSHVASKEDPKALVLSGYFSLQKNMQVCTTMLANAKNRNCTQHD